MSDLISRQDAIDLFQNLAYDDWNQGVVTSWADAYSECAEMIRELPSAEPEVIRCKNCKHYYYTDNRVFGERTWVCDILNFEDLDEDEFCARAERRDA